MTIRYSTWGSTQEVALNKEIIKRFEEHNPGIEVKLVYIPGETYYNGLLTQIASGVGPDVMYINPQWSYPLYKARTIRSLQPYFNGDKELLNPRTFETKAYSGFRYDGKYFGTTNGTNIVSVFYNRDLIARAGLPNPPDDWTYTDFVEYAKKTTITAGGKTTQIGFEGIPAWYGTVLPVLWAFGGDLFDKAEQPTRATMSSKESLDALRFIQDLYYKYRVCPSSETPFSGSFTNGKAVMKWQGTWDIEQLKTLKNIRWDIAPIPKGKTRVVPFFLGGYVVSQVTKHPDEAWKFARFFQSEEAQKLIAKDGLITPIRRSVAESDLFLKLPGGPSRHRVRIDSMAEAKLADPLHVKFPKIVQDVVYPIWNRMLENKLSAAEAAKRIDDGANKLLSMK